MEITIKRTVDGKEVKRKFIVGFKYNKEEKCKKTHDEYKRQVYTHWFEYSTESFIYEVFHKPNSMKKYYGYSYCSYMDEYNKGVGQFIALKKALDLMENDGIIDETDKIKLIDEAKIDESYKEVYDVPNLGLKVTDEYAGEILLNLEKQEKENKKKDEEAIDKEYADLKRELSVENVEDDNTECAVLGAMELVGDKDEKKLAKQGINEIKKERKKEKAKTARKSAKKK